MQELYSLFIFCLLPYAITGQSNFTYTGWDGQIKNVAQTQAEKNIQGLSIAIIKDFQLDTVMNWGLADPDSKTSVQNQTLFQVGSMSNVLCGIAVLKAYEEGILDLEQDINQYLHTWKIPLDRFTKNAPVTTLDLLLKRRGFTQNQKPKGYTPGSEIPTLLQVLSGASMTNTKPVRLRSDTKEQKNYSFETEVILQQLLEDLYQQSYQEIIQEKIFSPLGLNNSTLNLQLTQDQLKQAAQGFSESDKAIPGKGMIFPETASSGLWTTSKEYALITLDLLRAYQGKSSKLLKSSTLENAFSKMNQDKAMLFNNWGPGAIIGYGGAPKGFYSTIEADPEQGWGIVILCNKHLQWQFVNELRQGIRKNYQF